MPKVGIIMGSDSDLKVMSKAAVMLEELGIEYEMTIISAHREPDELIEWTRGAEDRGIKVMIAGAGMAAALPGMCAALFALPVIGVPLSGKNLDGMDAVFSIMQMPPGVPVATVAIDGAKNAAILEGSKAFSKDLMKKYNIPTAAYENFTDPKAAVAYLETAKFPIVLKADGLALGKGVLICKDLEEAKAGVKEIMLDKKFGTAGNEMVIEEFMTGREVSVLSFVDGKTIKTMTSAQDHKRAGDGDTGLNTGGMGTFSPSPFYTKEVEEFCEKYVYQATVDAMAAEGRPFKGVIFFGLMLTEDGPKVLEYNARFGDPEAQVVLPRMKNDILEVMEACIDGTLDQVDLQFEDNAAVCVVLASEGYPVSYEKGFPITGLEEFKKHEGYYCFHAGTKFDGDQIVTNGGRVLGVTAKGKDLKEARANAYAATEWVNFKNKYMRHDIGKAIDEA